MMKQKTWRVLSGVCSLVFIASLLSSDIALADSNTIYINPATESLAAGASFTISVKGNIPRGNSNPRKVSGQLTFPKNLLHVTSVSTNGATFNWAISATPDNTAGTVTFSERSLFGASGSVFIMSVTFQALAAGSAQVGFSNSTTYDTGQTSLTGATYTITAAPPPGTCPAGQTGMPPNCHTPSPVPPSPKPSPTPSPTATPAPVSPTPPGTPGEPPAATQPSSDLSISDVSVTRAYSSATLNWATSALASNMVHYGSSVDELNKTADVTTEPDGTYDAHLTSLTPGKEYYFKIDATSIASSDKTSAYPGNFTTKGFPVSVMITENKLPASDAKLKISNDIYTTNTEGKVDLELASGTYDATVTTKKGQSSVKLAVKNVTIPEDGAPKTQFFNFDVNATGTVASASGNPFWMLGALVMAGLAGGSLVFYSIYRSRRLSDNSVAVPAPEKAAAGDQQPENVSPVSDSATNESAEASPETAETVQEIPEEEEEKEQPAIGEAVSPQTAPAENPEPVSEQVQPPEVQPQPQQSDATSVTPSDESEIPPEQPTSQ